MALFIEAGIIAVVTNFAYQAVDGTSGLPDLLVFNGIILNCLKVVMLYFL